MRYLSVAVGLVGAVLFLAAVKPSGTPATVSQQPSPGGPAVSPVTRPDLADPRVSIAATAVAMRPALSLTELKKGQKYKLICRFTNAGAALKGVWKLGYVIDGQLIWNQYWGDVPAGATQTKSYSEYVPSAVGPHTYECRLDFDAEIAERNENNNQAKMSFKVVK